MLMYKRVFREMIWNFGKWQSPLGPVGRLFHFRTKPNVTPIQARPMLGLPIIPNTMQPSVTSCRNIPSSYCVRHHHAVGSACISPRVVGVQSSQDRRGFAEKDSARNQTLSKIDPMERYRGLEPSNLKLGFEKVKELEDANEQVKKIFSLEFADAHEIQIYRKAKLVKDIQKDPTDESLPVKIATMTIHIRAVAKQISTYKKNTLAKEKLLGMIGKRRGYLKELRNTDYERFERILIELGITYTLPPPKQAVRLHTRRYLEKLVVRKKAREQRIKALHEFLAKRKEKQMREIVELKKELGLDISEEEMSYVVDPDKSSSG